MPKLPKCDFGLSFGLENGSSFGLRLFFQLNPAPGEGKPLRQRDEPEPPGVDQRPRGLAAGVPRRAIPITRRTLQVGMAKQEGNVLVLHHRSFIR